MDISQNFWQHIIIYFDAKKLKFLQSSNCSLYILQGVISTNSQQCWLSLGASVELRSLNEKTDLTILVDQWPFWFAALANKGYPPDEDSYDILHQVPNLMKQSLNNHFFEVCPDGNSSPIVKFIETKTVSKNVFDDYTLTFSNNSSNSFYIGLGRAFQWAVGEQQPNDYPWKETVMGYNCFFRLDSYFTAYLRPSAGIVLLISAEKWKNGKILPDQLSGYYPCYFQAEKKHTLKLHYSDSGWKKIRGYSKLNLIDKPILTRKCITDLLIANFSDTSTEKESRQKLYYGNKIKLCVPQKEGYIVSSIYSMTWNVMQYLPQFNASDIPINLVLSGGTGVLKDGYTVKIETSEKSVGEYKVLGAWKNPSLYYYKDGYENQKWTIRKKDNSNSVIHYGDEVYFLNHYYTGQWLCLQDSGSLLTTKISADTYWLIDEP